MDPNHDWYTKPDWRNAYIEETVRCLSKTGSLGEDEVLVELAAVLSEADVIGLYNALKQSMRPEAEWRQEFLSIFTGVREDDLPAIEYVQPPIDEAETPAQFRPPRLPLDIQSDEDIPF